MSIKLDEFIENLVKLQNNGHGDKEVYMIDSRSGCAVALYSAHISDYIGEAGPFDLENKEYISITGDH